MNNTIANSRTLEYNIHDIKNTFFIYSCVITPNFLLSYVTTQKQLYF